MQKIINIHVEKLPEWVYLATSEDMPGLVPQGWRVIESLKISGIFQGSRRLNEESQRRKNLWKSCQESLPAIHFWVLSLENGVTLGVKPVEKVRNNLPFLKELASKYFMQKS